MTQTTTPNDFHLVEGNVQRLPLAVKKKPSLPSDLSEHRLLNAKQMSELLGMSERNVWRMVEDGEIPSYKISGSRRFKWSEILWWLEKQKA